MPVKKAAFVMIPNTRLPQSEASYMFRPKLDVWDGELFVNTECIEPARLPRRHKSQ